jgi:hypothetical protein
MKKIITLLTTSILIVLSYNLNAQLPELNAQTISENIDYNYFFKSLEYLSSDELEGRDVGTEGYNKAAQYVADEFQKNGLLPFGDDGTYFQKVTFTNPKIIESSVKINIALDSKSIHGIYGENFTMVASDQYKKVDEKQKLVFVGYGNILPEDSINDYEGVDVKGKTIIAALGGPKNTNNSKVYDLFFKVDAAKSQGASGIILFYPKTGILQNTIFKRIHGLLNSRMLYFQDTTFHGEMLEIGMDLGSYARRDLIKDILKINGLSFRKEFKKAEEGINVSRELNCSFSYAYDVKIETIECKNVVAVLPGSDPVLKNEYVLLSAHLDHLGIGKAVKGDSIYNGMWDNASGSATVVSISKEIGNLPQAPRRSIIFTCLTAEEKGLLGSTYFAEKKVIASGEIVANLNMDMTGSLFETKDIVPIGYTHSNLSEAIDYTAKTMNVEISDSKAAEDDRIERSDQISFIEKGIPALNISHGYKAVDPKIKGQKILDKWMEKYYHSPADDMNQEYSDKAFLDAIKANFLTLYYISDMMDEIKWNEESWLYEKYVAKEE